MKLFAQLLATMTLAFSGVAAAQCDMNDKSCYPAQIEVKVDLDNLLAQCDMKMEACGPAEFKIKTLEFGDLLACDNPSCINVEFNDLSSAFELLACNDPSCMAEPVVTSREKLLACDDPGCMFFTNLKLS